MTRSRLALIVVTLLLVGLAAATMILSQMSSPVPVDPAARATPPALSVDELRFYEAVAPVLRAAAGEARQLTAQGQERSRNLFAIRAGQGRLSDHLATLDPLLTDAATPERFAAVASVYQAAATDVRTSMRQAEAAFLRFDWDSVGAATELMAAGTAQLEAATAQLDAAAGVAPGTPEA